MNQEVKRIKQEDKKALKGFSMWMVLALVVGAVLGLVICFAKYLFADDIGSSLAAFMYNIVLPYGMPVVMVVILVAVVILYDKGKRLFLSWDGEDEDVIDKAGEYLSYALWLSSMNLIWNYFIFGAAFSGSIWEKMRQGVFSGFVWTLVFFMVGLVVIMIEQQKIVNLTKQMNPEKHGSVFDMKFRKKWEESCDEAEKLQIYQCAYRAYSVVQIECVVLWLVCLIGSFIWNFGIMPIAIITIIWGTMTTVYSMEAIKLSKRSNK